MAGSALEIRSDLRSRYADVYTPAAMAALEALSPLDEERNALMRARMAATGRARARPSSPSRSWIPQPTIA